MVVAPLRVTLLWIIIGDVILVDEDEDVLKCLIILTLGIIPAHSVHPNWLLVICQAPVNLTVHGHSLCAGPCPCLHPCVLTHSGALPCTCGPNTDDAAVAGVCPEGSRLCGKRTCLLNCIIFFSSYVRMFIL